MFINRTSSLRQITMHKMHPIGSLSLHLMLIVINKWLNLYALKPYKSHQFITMRIINGLGLVLNSKVKAYLLFLLFFLPSLASLRVRKHCLLIQIHQSIKKFLHFLYIRFLAKQYQNQITVSYVNHR